MKQASPVKKYIAAHPELTIEGWDGYGGKSIDPLAVEAADHLLDALPEGIPLPDIIPEPTGWIGLQWDVGRSTAFILRCSDKGYGFFMEGLKGRMFFGVIHGESTVPSGSTDADPMMMALMQSLAHAIAKECPKYLLDLDAHSGRSLRSGVYRLKSVWQRLVNSLSQTKRSELRGNRKTKLTIKKTKPR